MRIVICAKEVLDPDAVNNYALAGRLVIGEDGVTLTQTTIPQLMNAYDEQALEAPQNAPLMSIYSLMDISSHYRSKAGRVHRALTFILGS